MPGPAAGSPGLGASLPSGRVPCLDGLRGISVCLVMLAHLSGTRELTSGARLPDLYGLGNLGVRVFFVISGFLITLLLLRERASTGRISLSRFFVRRALRILPAAFLYIGVILLLGALGYIVLAPGDRLHALTYTVNYHHLRSWYVSHLWSLSVEEQFYLLWPALLVLAGTRRGLWLAAALVLAAPVVRTWLWLFAPPERHLEIGEAFSTIGDALATGCLLAGLGSSLDRRAGYLRFLRSGWFVAVPLVLVLANVFQSYPIIDYPVGQTVLNVSIALCIDRCRRLPEGWVGRLLESRALAGLGVLSYSLYLWQEPFLNRWSRSPLTRFPVSILLVFGAAAASYLLVERPLMRWRRQLR